MTTWWRIIAPLADGHNSDHRGALSSKVNHSFSEETKKTKLEDFAVYFMTCYWLQQRAQYSSYTCADIYNTLAQGWTDMASERWSIFRDLKILLTGVWMRLKCISLTASKAHHWHINCMYLVNGMHYMLTVSLRNTTSVDSWASGPPRQ